MTMTVEELIELLSDLPPETEVRLASQPSWPMEWAVSTVIQPDYDDDNGAPVVYLAEGAHVGYLPRAIASQLGWGK